MTIHLPKLRMPASTLWYRKNHEFALTFLVIPSDALGPFDSNSITTLESKHQ